MLSRSVKDHESIIAALETRDAEVIADAMVRHMRSVHDTTKAAMAAAAKDNG